MDAIMILIGVGIGAAISVLVTFLYMRKFSNTFFHPYTKLTAKELRDMGLVMPECPDGVRPAFLNGIGLVIRWYGTQVGIVSYKIHGKDGYDPDEMKYDGARASRAVLMSIDYEYRFDDDETWVSVPEDYFKELVRAAGDMG